MSPVAGVPTYQWDGTKWTTYVANATRAAAFDGAMSMDGAASAGSSGSYARADHVHPIDTSRAPVLSPAFTGTVTAYFMTLSGTLTINGKLTAAAKQHRIGTHGGVGAGGAVTQADAHLMFYDGGGGNWCGFGCRFKRQLWLRSGTSGSPAPSFYMRNDQIPFFLNTPTIPTAGAGDNSTNLASTAFVKARAGGGQLHAA